MNNSSSLIISLFLLRFMVDWLLINISNSQDGIWAHFQTSRSSSKILLRASYFQLSSCLELCSNMVFCVLMYHLNASTISHLYFLQMANPTSGLAVNTLSILVHLPNSSILFIQLVLYQVELHVLALANVGIGEERVARKLIHKAMVQVCYLSITT